MATTPAVPTAATRPPARTPRDVRAEILKEAGAIDHARARAKSIGFLFLCIMIPPTAGATSFLIGLGWWLAERVAG